MVYPNPQIYHHLRVIFVHVPKTAGTAIERALRESPLDPVGGHTTALGYRGRFPGEFATYFKFAVVRHPVSRFLSAWSYLRGTPVHPALNNAGIHACGSFEKWMRQVRDDPGLLDHIVHLLPQHRFVCGTSGELLVDRLYRFETLEEAWDDICERLGLPKAPLPRINPSRLKPGIRLEESEREWIAEHYTGDFGLGGYGRTAD
jgi:hypothetical protein